MLPADISSSSFCSSIAGPKRPREIEVTRVDCAWPTHECALYGRNCLPEIAVLGSICADLTGILRDFGLSDLRPALAAGRLNCRISSKCSNLVGWNPGRSTMIGRQPTFSVNPAAHRRRD